MPWPRVLPEAPPAVDEDRPVGMMAAPPGPSGWSGATATSCARQLPARSPQPLRPASGGSCCRRDALGQPFPSPPTPRPPELQSWQSLGATCRLCAEGSLPVPPAPHPVQGQARTPARRGSVATHGHR